MPSAPRILPLQHPSFDQSEIMQLTLPMSKLQEIEIQNSFGSLSLDETKWKFWLVNLPFSFLDAKGIWLGAPWSIDDDDIFP